MDFHEYWRENTFEISERVEQIRNLLKLGTTNGVVYKRYGSVGDGGYVLASDLQSHQVLVSCGVDNNVDFERALSPLVAKVLLFDDSIDSLPAPVGTNAEFQKRRIGTSVNELNLETIFADIEASSQIILKVDIEGSEWAVFSEEKTEVLSRCSQITFEAHWLRRIVEPSFFEVVVRALENLRLTHTPVLVHANNNQPLLVMGAKPIPNVFEVLYLNNALYEFSPVSDAFENLLARNDINFPEIGLSFP